VRIEGTYCSGRLERQNRADNVDDVGSGWCRRCWLAGIADIHWLTRDRGQGTEKCWLKSKVSHSPSEPEGGLYDNSLLYVASKFCTGSVEV
jgi:hypothetical protein